ARAVHGEFTDTITNSGRQHQKEVIQVVRDLMLGDFVLLEIHCWFHLCPQSMLLCCDRRDHNIRRRRVGRLNRTDCPWALPSESKEPDSALDLRVRCAAAPPPPSPRELERPYNARVAPGSDPGQTRAG